MNTLALQAVLVSVATTQLCPCSKQTASHQQYVNECTRLCSIKLYKNKLHAFDSWTSFVAAVLESVELLYAFPLYASKDAAVFVYWIRTLRSLLLDHLQK